MISIPYNAADFAGPDGIEEERRYDERYKVRDSLAWLAGV